MLVAWENAEFDMLIVDVAKAGGGVALPCSLPCFFLDGILVVTLQGRWLRCDDSECTGMADAALQGLGVVLRGQWLRWVGRGGDTGAGVVLRRWCLRWND